MATQVDTDDLRADLMSAFEQHDTDGGLDGGEQQEQQEQAVEQTPESGEQQSQQQRERDPSGRFAPRTPAKDTVSADGKPAKTAAEVTPDGQSQQPAQQGQQQQQVQQPDDKAPASWTTQEKEHWAKATPEIKAAIRRREQHVDRVLRESADSRRFQDTFINVFRPYADLVQSEGSNFVAATQNLFESARVLRSGNKEQKAGMVADMIRQFGIDIEMLDDFLAQAQRPENRYIERVISQRLPQQRSGPVRQEPQQTQVPQHIADQFDAFMSDPANEYAEEVLPIMADLMMGATQRGEVLSLQDAYQRATLAHPEVSKKIRGQQGAQSPAQLNAAARRAMNAAASVGNSGAPSGGKSDPDDEDDGTIRGALASSIRSLSGSKRL